ncbi:MAG TPA: hypothetical protein V6D22_13055 [Candidatus Obscuribacterales bacterium]
MDDSALLLSVIRWQLTNEHKKAIRQFLPGSSKTDSSEDAYQFCLHEMVAKFPDLNGTHFAGIWRQASNLVLNAHALGAPSKFKSKAEYKQALAQRCPDAEDQTYELLASWIVPKLS